MERLRSGVSKGYRPFADSGLKTPHSSGIKTINKRTVPDATTHPSVRTARLYGSHFSFQILTSFSGRFPEAYHPQDTGTHSWKALVSSIGYKHVQENL